MSNNVSNILYPNSSFIIDKIYTSYKEACNKAATDGIFLGRYVLIAYTEQALPYATRQAIFIASARPTEDPQKTYWDNLDKDDGIDYDRVICRKEYKEGNYTYTPIANLSTSMDWDVPSGNIKKETEGQTISYKVMWCGKVLSSVEYTLKDDYTKITIAGKDYNITYINDDRTYGVFGENEFLKSFDTIAYKYFFGAQELNTLIKNQLTWQPFTTATNT